MRQTKDQPDYAIISKSIYPSSRQKSNKRQSFQPNQIFITDFSSPSHRFEIKKKRCPFFLINRAQKKKNNLNNSVFTSQGILFQTVQPPDKFYHPTDRNQSVSKVKINSLVAKKQTLNSAYNFTRTITPKKVSSVDFAKDFVPFNLYPQGRYLQSAHTDRQKTKIVKRRSNSTHFIKEKLKSQRNQGQGKQIGAWRTIQVDFDELM